MPVQSFTYSIPYLLFLLYFVILMFLEFRLIKYDKDIKYIRWAVMIGFVLMFGLRGFIYSDWLVYYPIFEEMPTIWEGGLVKVLQTDFADKFVTDVSTGKAGIELGFVYFTLLFKSIVPDYHAWVFFNTIIDLLLLNIFLKRYSRYYVLAFILFIVFGGLITECNLMRNVKAILLFLISIKYLQERKIIPYLLINLAGTAFHSSAFIFLPLYFFLHKEIPRWMLWSIFILGNALFLLQISYLEPIMLSLAEQLGGRVAVQIKLYFALDLYNQRVGIGMVYFEQIITFILITLFQRRLIEQNEYNKMFINAYVIYFIFYFFFAEIMVAVERMTLLFVFSFWILIPEIIGLIKQMANKLVLILLLTLYCAFKLVLMNSNIFAKYDNVLFGIENFDVRSQRIYNDMENLLNPN